MRRIAVAVVCCSLLVWGCGESNQSVEKPATSSRASKDGEVLARVGTTIITRKDFLTSYQKHGHGQKPAVYLNKMIDQALLLQEARVQKIQDTEVLHSTERKALVRALLRRDFEQWFSPNDIDLLQVRKYYYANIRKYSRPVLAKVVHILVRLPSRRNAKDWTERDKQEYKRRAQRSKARAQEMLRELHKLDPSNAKAFLRLGARLAQKWNTINPQILKWSKDANAMLRAKKKKMVPLQELLPILRQARVELKRIPLCEGCRDIMHLLAKVQGEWEKKGKEGVTWLNVKQAIELLKKIGHTRERNVIYENLPPFPEKATRYYPAMVDEFARATFQLKDKEYSKELCKSSFGYHVIFRQKTHPSFEISLLQAAPKIRQTLFEKLRPKKYKQWLQLKFKKYQPVGYLKRLKRKRRK